MERGWDASGRLAIAWKPLGGRDRLAEATGIGGTTLSAYNSGKRPLGIANARRIAAATGVSLADLGAPAAAVDKRSLPILDRLEALEVEVALLAEEVIRRLAALEAAPEKTVRRSTPRRRTNG